MADYFRECPVRGLTDFEKATIASVRSRRFAIAVIVPEIERLFALWARYRLPDPEFGAIINFSFDPANARVVRFDFDGNAKIGGWIAVEFVSGVPRGEVSNITYWNRGWEKDFFLAPRP